MPSRSATHLSKNRKNLLTTDVRGGILIWQTKKSIPAFTCGFRSQQVNITGFHTKSAVYSRGLMQSAFFMFRRCFTIATKEKETQINEQIRDAEVRVIGADGEQLGVMSAREAQKLADERELDLVKIAPNAQPPVCRIMDYGKYRFEQAKREKEARKNQRVVEVKEVRLGLNTDIADFQTKVRHAIRFVEGGDKVKVSIRFRGREMGHPEIGMEMMQRFAEAVKEAAVVERPAKMEGRHMLMFLAPKPAK